MSGDRERARVEAVRLVRSDGEVPAHADLESAGGIERTSRAAAVKVQRGHTDHIGSADQEGRIGQTKVHLGIRRTVTGELGAVAFTSSAFATIGAPLCESA